MEFLVRSPVDDLHMNVLSQTIPAMWKLMQGVSILMYMVDRRTSQCQDSHLTPRSVNVYMLTEQYLTL